MFEILTKNSALTGLQNNSVFTLLNCRLSLKSKAPTPSLILTYEYLNFFNLQ